MTEAHPPRAQPAPEPPSTALPPTRERLRRALGAAAALLALAVAGYLGGCAVTSLWPVTAQTEHFRAQVRVTPSPSQLSTVHNPTVFGDIDLLFGGPVPAPGIEARVQVREQITDVFSTARVDIDALTPDPVELRAAMEGGLAELAWKFGAGVVGINLLVVGLWLVGRPRRPWRPVAATVAGAAVVATAVPGTAAGLTYRADNLVSFTTTSLLGTVRSNSGMFTDIRGQAQQATPYVQNLLALSDALQGEFLPEETTRPTAARFLLVSDLHGMNYYPLMERIIENEDITAVIDTGDLVNFGRVAEGEVAGMYEAIEDLGVPYLFVRGNHDATGAADEALLRRLQAVPNVILLEPTAGEYVEASVHGVRVTGFNDWRYFGEDLDDYGAQQREAAARYTEATSGWPLADVVLSHQPYAVREVPTGGVRVSGHMHRPDLLDRDIWVGSFTGGGLVNHFQVPELEDEETAGELVGQPYAFDILSFGQDCAVSSLTRYTFRNLVSGRPQYDGVSVVNGSRVAPPPEDQDRTCSAGHGVATQPIEPVEAGRPPSQGLRLSRVSRRGAAARAPGSEACGGAPRRGTTAPAPPRPR